MEVVGVGRSPHHTRRIMEARGVLSVVIPGVRGVLLTVARPTRLEAQVFFMVEGVVGPGVFSQMGSPVALLYTEEEGVELAAATAAARSDPVVRRYMAGPVEQALDPLVRVV